MIINQRRIGNSLQRTWAVAKWKKDLPQMVRERERETWKFKLPTWLCGTVSIPSAPATTSTSTPTPISVFGRQKHKHETKHFVRLACKIVFVVVVVSYCCPALWLLLAKNWLRPGQNSWSCSWSRVQVSVCSVFAHSKCLQVAILSNYLHLTRKFNLKNNEQIVVAVVSCCFCC